MAALNREGKKQAMSLLFSLGIRQMQELSALQCPGFYWVNIDRQADANSLCQQLIAAQEETRQVVLICHGEKPSHLLNNLPSPALKTLPLYRLPAKKKALLHFSDDLMRALKPHHQLFILFAPATLWQNFSNTELQRWTRTLSDWLNQQSCTLIILSHSHGVNTLKEQLINQHRTLNGLSSLHWQQYSAQYLVNWWSTENGLQANQLLTLYYDQHLWQRLDDGSSLESTLTDSDENRYLVERSILEGAPALSDNWQLLESNTLLAQHGMLALAATLVFSIYQDDDLESLAQHIHNVRHQRGNRLKIVVREMGITLRYSDERLLLACGTNLIVPQNTPLPRFLTMLESIQGQYFPRSVSADLDTLLAGLRPLPLKGYLHPVDFSRALIGFMNNSLLPENSKGIIIALRPTMGLRVEQAMALCHLSRDGDLMTVVRGRLILFLTGCRVNDVVPVLKSLCRFPMEEIFSSRQIWEQDADIIAELKRMVHSATVLLTPPQKLHTRQQKAMTETERHQPVPLTLTTAILEEKVS